MEGSEETNLVKEHTHFTNGDKCREYKDGKEHVQNIYTWTQVRGIQVTENNGQFTSSDGGYEGGWKDGLKNGQGTLTYFDGGKVFRRTQK